MNEGAWLAERFEEHRSHLRAIAYRILGSPSDADDAVQEALVSIVRALPRFDGRSRFGTWAYRIAVNASLDELRRRRRRAEPGLPGDHDVGVAAGPDRPSGPGSTGRTEPVARSPVTNSSPSLGPRRRLLSTRTVRPASRSRGTTSRPSVPVPPVTRMGAVVVSMLLFSSLSELPLSHRRGVARLVGKTDREEGM